MFEKEAEKYAENNAYKYASDYITCQEAYKDGAEFGYNKAKEELEKENAELKEQCLILADCNTCHSTCKNENIEMKKQLTKAKEIIKRLHDIVCGKSGDDWELIEEAEQLIK